MSFEHPRYIFDTLNIVYNSNAIMSTYLKMKLNDKIYLRDPEETELGRKIIQESIEIIHEVGFEQFTFKKLATAIQSTEASIYRYFENKHMLLVYLVSWYWVWLDFIIDYKVNNISSPSQKLSIILKVIANPIDSDANTFLNERKLHRIVISESSKVYLTKEVDQDNKKGMFGDYKKLCKKIAAIILQVDSSYPYANTLVSTLIETSHCQQFFALHLPSLTNFNKDKNSINNYLEQLLFSVLKKKNA